MVNREVGAETNVNNVNFQAEIVKFANTVGGVERFKNSQTVK